MKKILISVLLTVGVVLAQESSDQTKGLAIEVTAKQQAKFKLMLGLLDQTAEVEQVATNIKRALEFSGQFEVELRAFGAIKSKEQVHAIAQEGYPLALFIGAGSPSVLIWRLYDVGRVAMIQGKSYQKRGEELRGWAYNIADDVWPLLTGVEGIFSTKIAYCKTIFGKKQGMRPLKHICIADFDGSNEQFLVTTPTVNLAPRWNADARNPLLFYSESTNANVRLMSINLQGKRTIASNFDGLNMCPAFSHDGASVVYCASRGNGSCQLYFYGKGVFKRLTHNAGNNVSPSLADDGSKLFFCSDYLQGKPQICRYSFGSQTCEPITDSGYAYCPAYHQKKGNVAYCKMVNGYMQLFVFDEKTNEHKQLTFDASNKDECCWSACGTYLMAAVEQKGKSFIALFDAKSGSRRVLTRENESCSYPAWSPKYAQFPATCA